MLKEFLIAQNDGRCIYYLSEKEHNDPQLTSGYLASLGIFMQIHDNRIPKGIILNKGQWVIEHNTRQNFFIGMAINSDSRIDEKVAREVIEEIQESIHIIMGIEPIPLMKQEKQIWEIVDQTIKNKLIKLTGKKQITNFGPGLLKEKSLNSQKSQRSSKSLKEF